MTQQTVTLELSEGLYQRLQHRARQTHRSVADEVLDLVAAAIPVDDELPADLVASLAPLPAMTDAALWRVARSTVPVDAAAELEALHWKRQREGLSESEAARAAELTEQFEHVMLMRAEAAVLLQERGHDISVLAPRSVPSGVSLSSKASRLLWYPCRL